MQKESTRNWNNNQKGNNKKRKLQIGIEGLELGVSITHQ